MTTYNLYPTNSNKPASQTEMWIWKSDIYKIRNHGFTHVSWGPTDQSKSRFITITVAQFINAIDKKQGVQTQTPKSWYITMPLTVFASNPQAVTSVTPTTPVVKLRKARAKPSIITVYKIVPRTDKKFGIEAVRGQGIKLISKIFDTKDQATTYIRGPLRRPNFIEQ